jgi:hypothetical protein
MLANIPTNVDGLRKLLQQAVTLQRSGYGTHEAQEAADAAAERLFAAVDAGLGATLRDIEQGLAAEHAAAAPRARARRRS